MLTFKEFRDTIRYFNPNPKGNKIMPNISEAISWATFLNELLEYDQSAVTALMNAAVVCDDKLLNHPSMQIIKHGEKAPAIVSVLGILNGKLGIYSRTGYGPLSIELNLLETGRNENGGYNFKQMITKFNVCDESGNPLPEKPDLPQLTPNKFQREDDIGPYCNYCWSSLYKKHWWSRKSTHCIQPDCLNYYGIHTNKTTGREF